MRDEEDLRLLLGRFPVSRVAQLSPMEGGLIHQSYLVVGSLEGGEGPRYVLQGLHHKLSGDAILSDHAAVSEHLKGAGLLAPAPVRSLDGALAVSDPKDARRRWRLLEYIPGVTIFGRSASVEEALIAGGALADFHQAMMSFSGRLRSTHPGHDTAHHLQALRDAFQAAPSELQREYGARCEVLAARLESLILPEELPRSIVHGDPKLTNFRFEERSATLIDLDTCALHTRLVDLGDALRSWCAGPEDQRGSVSWLRAEAFLEGYLSRAPALSPLERVWLPRCAETITLELCARFTRDIFEDSYFAYDSGRYESRRAHNHARSLGMEHLAAEFAAGAERLSALCAS